MNRSSMPQIMIAITALAAFIGGGCACSLDQKGRLTDIKQGMTRTEVIQIIGEPPHAPIFLPSVVTIETPAYTTDVYMCDGRGNVVEINVNEEMLFIESALTLGIAGLVDEIGMRNSLRDIRGCFIRYTNGRVIPIVLN